MSAFNELFNEWQDVCYPGLNRPFKVVEYVSNERIIISDSRQGNAKKFVSLNDLRSQIQLRRLENRHGQIQRDTEKLQKQMAKTADASARKQLSDKLTELTKEGAAINGQMDELRP